MNKIDRPPLSSNSARPPREAQLADFNSSKKPKEREAASKLLTLVAIKVAERDPETAGGKMKSPTEYMASGCAYFETKFPSRPFAFQRNFESYYRKALVPDFHSVESERFIALPKHKQRFLMNVVDVARDYYLDVLIATVRSELSYQSNSEALVMLYDYINFSETTRAKLAAYLSGPTITEAIASAEIPYPRVYQLLAGWKELFVA